MPLFQNLRSVSRNVLTSCEPWLEAELRNFETLPWIILAELQGGFLHINRWQPQASYANTAAATASVLRVEIREALKLLTTKLRNFETLPWIILAELQGGFLYINQWQPQASYANTAAATASVLRVEIREALKLLTTKRNLLYMTSVRTAL